MGWSLEGRLMMLASEPRRELQEAVLAAMAPREAPKRSGDKSVRAGVIVWTAIGLPITTAAVWATAAVVGLLTH